jgi:alpha-mannosidase
MRFIVFVLLGLFLINNSICQVFIPESGKQHILNGYIKSLQGEVLPYFSVYPEFAKEALLTRCTNGNKIIEWETSAIPYNISDPYFYFCWIAAHSTGTNTGIRNFDLFINDEFILTFKTYPEKYPEFWSFTGRDSVKLVFELKKQDVYHDAHGLAYLQVPSGKYKKGNNLRIKVVGQNQNSNDWFMTFKFPLNEKINVKPLPFLLNTPKNMPLKRPLLFTILHFGPNEKLIIKINNSEYKFNVIKGENKFDVPIDALSDKSTVRVEAILGNLASIDTVINLNPANYREIFLIHHSHTDIGYSNLQEDVVKIQNKNIRIALRQIDKTENYPDGSRFAWNIESLWAVENFLSVADDGEKIKFFRAVRDKQIGLSGFYANVMTGLCTEKELDWITEYASYLRDTFKLPVTTVMFNDIPGISWTMVKSLAKNKIRYFSYGPNYIENLPDCGDRIGSTIKYLGNKAFWWRSSNGKDSILLWTCGKGYSSWHRFSPGEINERGENKIASYLDELDSAGYPYKMVQWLYSIVSDNGPADTTISDFVRSWNEKYSSPRLILSDVGEMFKSFEYEYGKSLPSITGDFTPYWEDGAYSTAFEEGENRLLCAKLLQLIDLGRQENLKIDNHLLYLAKRSIVMFHEHTWGSWCSISEPDIPFTTKQWEYKKQFIDSAKYYIKKIEQSMFVNSPDAVKVEVINTLHVISSGYIEMQCPPSFNGNIIKDEKGNKFPVQKLSDGKICFIAGDVPPNSKKNYYLISENINFKFIKPSFTYNIDNATGVINSLKFNGKEYVNKDIYNGIFQALYVKGLNPDSSFVTKVKKATRIENGPVVSKYLINCSLEGTESVDYEISEYHGLDYLQLSCIIDKKKMLNKESMHIVFPFTIEKPVVRLGIDSSFITPEKGQLPCANRDFYCVQHWLDISNDNTGVTICCPQGALFEIGSMTDERPLNNGYKKWKSISNSSSTIFLYALNNYWNTNFKASQEGKVRFDCYLQFHNVFEFTKSYNFGETIYQPLISIVR